jgi:hypothetical protein
MCSGFPSSLNIKTYSGRNIESTLTVTANIYSADFRGETVLLMLLLETAKHNMLWLFTINPTVVIKEWPNVLTITGKIYGTVAPTLSSKIGVRLTQVTK